MGFNLWRRYVSIRAAQGLTIWDRQRCGEGRPNNPPGAGSGHAACGREGMEEGARADGPALPRR